MFDIMKKLAAESTGRLEEEVQVNRDDLGDVRHGVLGQAGGLGREQDVPWRVHQSHVGRQDDDDHRPEPTPVERVILDDEDRAAEPRL
jgi:hypothetical protein